MSNDKKIPEKNKAIFLKNVFKLIEDNGLTQKEFNSKIGGKRDISSRWKGTPGIDPSLESCIKIKQVFGVSLDWLLCDEVKPVADQPGVSQDEYNALKDKYTLALERLTGFRDEAKDANQDGGVAAVKPKR